MPRIKRAHYFTNQFLNASDFNDEQSYHVKMRYRHNGLLHAWGVANGFAVSRAAARQVTITPGVAIDALGRELVIEDPLTPPAFGNLGNGVDVYLTLSYGETTDPADHYTTDDVDDFVRTVEEPRVTFSTTVPPADGSVILLARIHLNGSGNIDEGAIDTSVRRVASAQIAPKAIGTAQLADNAVTLEKLAHDVQPMTFQSANAITVATDNDLRRVTIGESHSGLTGNPHHTTAADIDTEGGTNRIVARINAGTGIIARTRIEPVAPTAASGVITFRQIPVNQEMFSDFIDPGLGAGALCVQLSIEDLPTAGTVFAGDESYNRLFRYRSEVNKSTGQFKVFITQNFGGALRDARVRWFAFKAQAAPDGTVDLGISVIPPDVNMLTGQTRGFTASFTHATSPSVTWSAPDGGQLSTTTGPSVTFTPPNVTKTYRVRATQPDTGKFAEATVHMTAEIAVVVNPPSVSMLNNQQVQLIASVNSQNPAVTWSISPTGRGTISPPSGSNTVTYTPPSQGGTYTVRATSVADQGKFYDCQITVTELTVTVNVPTDPLPINQTFLITSHVNWPSESRVTWEATAGDLSNSGPSNDVFYTAPPFGGRFFVTATSVADTTKKDQVPVEVFDPGGGGGGGGDKFIPTEGISDTPPAEIEFEFESPQPTSKDSSATAKARSSVAPRKRPK